MKKWWGWVVRFLAGVAATAFILFMLSVAYDAGTVDTKRAVVKQLTALSKQSKPVLYDIAFYSKNELKVWTVPVRPESVSVVPGAMDSCVVIKRPQYRLYCGVVALYPCTRGCTETK